MDLSFPLGKINRFFRHLCTLVNDHQDVVLQGEWGEQSSVHGGPRLPAYAGSTPAEGPETAVLLREKTGVRGGRKAFHF